MFLCLIMNKSQKTYQEVFNYTEKVIKYQPKYLSIDF